MKESKIYLSFFKKNLKLIGLCAFLVLAVICWYLASLPQAYVTSSTWKISSQDNLSESSLKADQLVSETRLFAQQQLKEKDLLKIIVYKSGPLQMTVELHALNKEILSTSMERIKNYANGQLPIEQISQSEPDVKGKAFLQYVFLGLVGGALLGILFSLLLTYIREY